MHDRCIKALTDEFGEMDRGLDFVNMSGMHLAPLKRLTRLQDRYGHVSVSIEFFNFFYLEDFYGISFPLIFFIFHTQYRLNFEYIWPEFLSKC
jgi:hypothetical protein